MIVNPICRSHTISDLNLFHLYAVVERTDQNIWTGWHREKGNIDQMLPSVKYSATLDKRDQLNSQSGQ